MVFCGIDVGTQGARCVLVGEKGELLSQGRSTFGPPPRDLPEGWFEQDPTAWTDGVKEALGQALKGLDGGEVSAVGVTSTSGSVCVLDAAHRPLMRAIMYNDSRSGAEATTVQRAGTRLAARLGYRFTPSFALPKILWIQRQRPEVYARADLFLSPTDYVIGWLTGNWRRSDQTNVLKWGYDLVGESWPDFIEAELGLSLSLFPIVQKPGTLAGHLTAERCEELGLPAGTPVAAGMTDGCASQTASGAVAPGQYNTTIGTTLVIKGVSRDLLLDPLGRVYCHRHPAGWWLPGGASNTGAQCLAVEFGPEETEQRGARALDNSPTSLVAYPLTGKGERFPFLAPEAVGFVLGTPRDRDELFTAYLEGVACLERLAFETLVELGAEIDDTIFSAGGGARSEAWCQIRADTLNKVILCTRGGAATGAAMGAAILAASLERYGSVNEAGVAMVHVERAVEPRVDRLAAYAAKYDQFVDECYSRGYLTTTSLDSEFWEVLRPDRP